MSAKKNSGRSRVKRDYDSHGGENDTCLYCVYPVSNWAFQENYHLKAAFYSSWFWKNLNLFAFNSDNQRTQVS